MKTYFIKHTVLLTLPFILLFACKKDKKVAAEPDVYVGGYYFLKDGVTLSACYWKNGEFFPVKDSAKASNAYEMKVLNGSVYLVGQYNDQPCYWKDGVLNYLPNPNNVTFNPGSKAVSMVLFRGRGEASTAPILTFVGQVSYPTHLNLMGSLWQPTASDVAAKYNAFTFNDIAGVYQPNSAKVGPDSKLYISGSHANGQAGYWLVNYPTINPDYLITWTAMGAAMGSTYAVEFDKNDVYVFGNTPVNNQLQDVYWKNGQLQTFAYLTGQNFSINHFRVMPGGIICLAGDDNTVTSKACIFVDGVKTTLSTDPSNATNLTFYNSDTYVSGILNNTACYWKGTTLVDLKRPKSAAKFIAVMAK